MNLPQAYATALHEASKKGKSSEGLLASLKSALARRGHRKLLPRVFAEYEKIIAVRSRRGLKVRFARESDKAAALEAVKRFAGKKAEESFELCEDPSLVSGFVIESAAERLDASGKRALLSLYAALLAAR